MEPTMATRTADFLADVPDHVPPELVWNEDFESFATATDDPFARWASCTTARTFSGSGNRPRAWVAACRDGCSRSVFGIDHLPLEWASIA
jgi:hypothetical protein